MISSENEQPEVFAYKSTEKDFSLQTKRLADSLDKLTAISRELAGPFIQELKPSIAITLKWKFDYLTKTQESPFLLQQDIDYWIGFLEALKDLLKHNWFYAQPANNQKDPWVRTKEAFNYMWPRNTKKGNFEISLKMAKSRVNQIVSMIPENWMNGKSILDVGCGPGRYISAFLDYKPAKAVGLDMGLEIIRENKRRFTSQPYVQFLTGHLGALPFEDSSFDFVVSAGVIHHASDPIEKTIREHARVLAKNGYFFIYIAGQGGLELKMWEFVRNFLNDVPIEDMFRRFNGKIHPLRLQGMLDHSYGEYQQTSRSDCERWLSNCFTSIQRVSGVTGLDVTPELYKNDIYFESRFGTGNLRYLCKK